MDQQQFMTTEAKIPQSVNYKERVHTGVDEEWTDSAAGIYGSTNAEKVNVCCTRKYADLPQIPFTG
ncbi:hypothetical protein [Actinomadura nitritigenes]|uniref:hypothetical protein n=1 Tax=Actinomadura nitritigenes TaxID=134602 RepID=UPI003D8BCB24